MDYFLRNIKLKKQFTVAERETFFSYLGGQEKGGQGGGFARGDSHSAQYETKSYIKILILIFQSLNMAF